MIIAVIVLGALVLLLAGLLLKRPSAPADNQSALLLKEDLRALSEDITKLKDGVQTQI